MMKQAAFLAGFIATLAVVLVPIGESGLLETEAQSTAVCENRIPGSLGANWPTFMLVVDGGST